MKFIVDAQLPMKLAIFLRENQFDAIHTLELPFKNATTDEYIREISGQENRIVISKDSDFEDSFWLRNSPPKLILLSTGNITNRELLTLFETNLPKIVDLLKKHFFIEISQKQIIVHA